MNSLFANCCRHPRSLKQTRFFNKLDAKNRLQSLRNAHQASYVDRSRLRNIGIIAHINAGKTTTTERILFHAGSTQTVGDVDIGTTVTDYLVQERDRGITITSAAVTYEWKKNFVNLIDTPGHVDFTVEVERSLSVLDGAVTILDASAGVEAQTITVWNQAKKYRLPNIIFLNKLDKPMADYTMCMKDLKQALDISACLMQLPFKVKETQLTSLIDVIDRSYLNWPNAIQDNGSKFSIKPLEQVSQEIGQKYMQLTEQKREELINCLTDYDDQLADHVLECDKISDVSGDLIKKAVRRATLACDISPVFVGSSFKYIGVQQLMNAINDYLPNPIEREAQLYKLLGHTVQDQISDIAQTSCAFIFKITHDKQLGPLSFTRICSGSFSKLQRVVNLETKDSEQIKRVYRVFADEMREIDGSVCKDDIVAVTGLKNSRTGDILVNQNFILTDTSGSSSSRTGQSLKTLTSSNDEETSTEVPFKILNSSIIVPQISQMEPVYFCSIESKSLSEQMRFEEALTCLSREDPSFSYEMDEMGLTTIRGMGKLHLEIVRDRIESEYGIEPFLGPLQIAYREGIEDSASEELNLDKTINGVKSNVTIKLYVKPKAQTGRWRAKMLRIDASSTSSLGKLRRDHQQAITNGFLSAFNNGPTKGYPMIDCEVILQEFRANNRCILPIISSAAAQCLTKALKRCSPKLLEPIMLLEVLAPCEFNGTLLGDLSTRRALIVSTTAKLNGFSKIRAHTPLASLTDYSEYLRVATSGRGSFSLELLRYSAMSDSDQRNASFMVN